MHKVEVKFDDSVAWMIVCEQCWITGYVVKDRPQWWQRWILPPPPPRKCPSCNGFGVLRQNGKPFETPLEYFAELTGVFVFNTGDFTNADGEPVTLEEFLRKRYQEIA